MLNQNKLNENLRAKFLEDREKNERGGNNNDPRILNYYDLDFNQEIELLFLPDDAGELMYDYSTHAGAMGSGARSIACSYTSSRENCCVCEYGFEIYNRTKNKDKSAPWRRKSHTIGQVLPLKQPNGFSLSQSEDGNLVKIMYIPWGVREIIVDAVLNQTIDNPTEHVFVLKKTRNQGNRANYGKSFFRPEKIVLDPIFEEASQAGQVKTYDLRAEIPAPTSSEDMEVWLKSILEKGTSGNRFWDKYLPDEMASGDVETETVTTDAVQTELNKKLASGTPAQSAAPAKSSGPTLMERLNAARTKKVE